MLLVRGGYGGPCFDDYGGAVAHIHADDVLGAGENHGIDGGGARRVIGMPAKHSDIISRSVVVIELRFLGSCVDQRGARVQCVGGGVDFGVASQDVVEVGDATGYRMCGIGGVEEIVRAFSAGRCVDCMFSPSSGILPEGIAVNTQSIIRSISN